MENLATNLEQTCAHPVRKYANGPHQTGQTGSYEKKTYRKQLTRPVTKIKTRSIES